MALTLTPTTAKDHHFFIGQTLNQFKSGNPNEPYVGWMRKWPTEPLIRFFDFGNSEAVLINTLPAYREFLVDKSYSFNKPAFFARLIGDIVGVGIFFTEGDMHKAQRRFFNSTHPRKPSVFLGVI